MSKGIMIGKTEEETHNKETGLDLGDDFLGDLYICLKPFCKNFPLMWRATKDFYEEAIFAKNEITQLRDEIILFLSVPRGVSHDTEIWLRTIQSLCKEATGKNVNLFFVPD